MPMTKRERRGFIGAASFESSPLPPGLHSHNETVVLPRPTHCGECRDGDGELDDEMVFGVEIAQPDARRGLGVSATTRCTSAVPSGPTCRLLGNPGSGFWLRPTAAPIRLDSVSQHATQWARRPPLLFWRARIGVEVADQAAADVPPRPC